MSTHPKALSAAAIYLEMRGYRLIELNWRRSKQHIDIIAEKDNTIFMVSVIYVSDDRRRNSPLSALTESLVLERRKAADSWAEEEKWTGKYQLATVEIGDPNYAVISFMNPLD